MKPHPCVRFPAPLTAPAVKTGRGRLVEDVLKGALNVQSRPEETPCSLNRDAALTLSRSEAQSCTKPAVNTFLHVDHTHYSVYAF